MVRWTHWVLLVVVPVAVAGEEMTYMSWPNTRNSMTSYGDFCQMLIQPRHTSLIEDMRRRILSEINCQNLSATAPASLRLCQNEDEILVLKNRTRYLINQFGRTSIMHYICALKEEEHEVVQFLFPRAVMAFLKPLPDYFVNRNLEALGENGPGRLIGHLGHVTKYMNLPNSIKLGWESTLAFMSVIAALLRFGKLCHEMNGQCDLNLAWRPEDGEAILAKVEIQQGFKLDSRQYSIGEPAINITLPELQKENNAFIISIVHANYNPFQQDLVLRLLAAPILAIVLHSKNAGYYVVPKKQRLKILFPVQQLAALRLMKAHGLKTLEIVNKPVKNICFEDLQYIRVSVPPKAKMRVLIASDQANVSLLVVMHKDRLPIPEDFRSPFKVLDGLSEASLEGVYVYPELMVENYNLKEMFYDYYFSLFPDTTGNATNRRNMEVVKFSVLITVLSCVTRDENYETWTTQGCEISRIPDSGSVLCSCSHASVFSVAEIPQMLAIANGLTSFPNVFIFDSSYILAITCTVCLTGYLALLITVALTDRSETENHGLHIMTPVGDGENRYYYLVSVFTGNILWPGCWSTTASISMQIFGSTGSTKPFVIHDNALKVRTLRNNGLDSFLISSREDLGQLRYINLWKDDYGEYPDWHCRRVSIRSLNNQKVYEFLLGSTSCVKNEDGTYPFLRIDVAEQEHQARFSLRFKLKLYHRLAASCRWIRIYQRLCSLRDTRAQVLSCEFVDVLLTLILSTIFSRAFAKSGSVDEFVFAWRDDGVEVVTVSVVNVCILFPLLILLQSLFRFAKPKWIPTIFVDCASNKIQPTEQFVFGDLQNDIGADIAKTEVHPYPIRRTSFVNRRRESFTLPATNTADVEEWLSSAGGSPPFAQEDQVAMGPVVVRKLTDPTARVSIDEEKQSIHDKVQEIRQRFPVSFHFVTRDSVGIGGTENLIDSDIEKHQTSTHQPTLREKSLIMVNTEPDALGPAGDDSKMQKVPQPESELHHSAQTGQGDVRSHYDHDGYVFLFVCLYPPMCKNCLPHWFKYVGWIAVIGFAAGAVAVICYYQFYAVRTSSSLSFRTLIYFLSTLFFGNLIIGPLFLALWALIETIFSKGIEPVHDQRFQVIWPTLSITRQVAPYRYVPYAPLPSYLQLPPYVTAKLKIEKAELARTKLGCLSFIVHIFLLILLLPVMYSNFSSYDYLLNENTKRMFSFTPETAYQNFSHSWSEVADIKQFYEFFEMIMKQVQYPGSSSVVMVDNSSIILGVPRLHQYRISSSSACVEGVKAACISEESIQYDTSSYAPGWRSKPPNVPTFEDPWAYIRGKEVATDDGYLRHYPHDGYFVQLGSTLATSLSVLDYLERNHWIDNRTRGVFYEIAMYNIHLDRFIHTRLVLEVSAAEIWQTNMYSCPLVALSPTPLLTDELFICLMIVATALIVILQVAKVLMQVVLYQEERSFLVPELILLALTAMTAYVVYKHIQVETQFLANVENLGNEYHISLDEPCYWDLKQQIMCGITFSFGTILLWRFLHVTRPQFYILIVCLRTIAWLVVCQAVLFCLYLLAFAVMGHLVFGHHIFEFKTLAVSFINLFQESTRYYSIFSQVKDYNYVWGNVFEIMFTPFLAFVLLNIFVGLVSFGCSEARRIALERQRWMSCFTVVKRSMVSSYQQPLKKYTLSSSFHPTRIKALEVSVASFLQYCVNLPEFQRHIHLHQTANSLILGTEQAWKSTNSVSKLIRQRSMVERRINVMKLVTLTVLHLRMTEPKDSVKLRLLLHSVRSQIIVLRLLLTETKVTKLNSAVLELKRMLIAFKLRYLRLR